MVIAKRSKLEWSTDRTAAIHPRAATDRSVTIQLVGRLLVRGELHQLVEPQLGHIILLGYHSFVLPAKAAPQRIDLLHHKLTAGRVMLLPADLHQLLVRLDLEIFVQIVLALDLPQTRIVSIGHHELLQ